MSEVIIANPLSPDCIAENILKDKIINGVVGSLEGVPSSIGTLQTVVDGTYTFYYYQIGNIYIFVQGAQIPSNTGFIYSNETTRDRIKTILGKTTIDSYIQTNTAVNCDSYDYTGTVRHLNGQITAPILNAMILS